MAKRWPLSRYAEVMRRLQEIHPEIQFVFPGDQRDRELGDALAALCPNQRVLRAEGRTTLTQLAAMLTHCRLFIGGDSGPLHLAEAVGVPTLCIFGPTDPALLAPRGPQHQVLRGQVECGPCFTPRSGESPAEGICRQSSLRCMEAVTPQAVAEAALGMLAPDSKPGRISRARRPRA
jgi:ADP-heptose:LPS heptosyltransferase